MNSNHETAESRGNLPIRLGSVESLARTLHAVSSRRLPFEALLNKDKKVLRRQAEAVRQHFIHLNKPESKTASGDPHSITAHVDLMARIAAERPDDSGPTPALAAKSRVPRSDVLEKFAANGRLREVHLWAADEIRRLRVALDRNLASNSSSFAVPRVDRSRRIIDPTDRLGDIESIAYENRYRIWAQEASAAPVRAKRSRAGRPELGEPKAVAPGLNALTIVLRVVCENVPPTRIERELGLPIGRCVASLLATWLYRYAEIAEWVNDRKTINST